MPRRRATQPTTEPEIAVKLNENADDTKPEPTKRTRRPRQTKATKDVPAEALQALHDKVSGSSYMIIAAALPVAPTVDELDGVFIPLERIAIRHAPDPMKNAPPDQRDVFESVRHIMQYLVRGYLLPSFLAFLNRRNTPQGPAPAPAPAPARKPPKRPDAPEGLRETINNDSNPEVQLRKLHDYLTTASPSEAGE